MNAFDLIFVQPILNLLLAIYKILLFLHFPYALGFAIILLTVFIRFLLYPFISSQLKASRKIQKVQPHLVRLKELHKGDAKRLQEETLALYKEHGVNPAAGCLPALIQLPVIWALYSVLQKAVSLKPEKILEEVNKLAYSKDLQLHSLWDMSFFGLPLGHTPFQLFAATKGLILFVPLLTGVLQYFQSKMIMPQAEKKPRKKKQATDNKEPDFASVFQTQTLYLFPLLIAYFSFQFPLGLSLYWNTFTLFGIIQQYQIQRLEQKNIKNGK